MRRQTRPGLLPGRALPGALPFVLTAVVALGAGVVLGAGAGCAVRTRQAAVVPHMTPSPRSGQPVRGGLGEAFLHHSAVTHMRNPHEAPNANAGVYIPRYQIGAGARFRLGQNFDIGPVFEYGLRQGSFAVAEDVPPRPDKDTMGFGLSVAYSIHATSRFRIGIAVDTLLYFIPKVAYIDDTACSPPDWNCQKVDDDVDVVPVLALSVMPSVLVTRWLVLFGGITLRNHPTIDKESWTTTWDDVDVEMGPANVTLGAGAEFRLHKRVFLMLQLYYPVTRDPVVYYPVVGAGIKVSFGPAYQAPPKVEKEPPPEPAGPSEGAPPASPGPGTQPAPGPGAPPPPPPPPGQPTGSDPAAATGPAPGAAAPAATPTPPPERRRPALPPDAEPVE
jgi:hypothetical protein